jgi:hypothetical protein
MSGNILDSMSGGIEQARTVLVFVTNNYIRKVTSGNGNDNVRREFMFASARSEKMLKLEPVEFPMPGAIGMILGNDLFVDLCFVDAPTPDQMDVLIRETRRREKICLPKRGATLRPTRKAPQLTAPSATGAPSMKERVADILRIVGRTPTHKHVGEQIDELFTTLFGSNHNFGNDMTIAQKIVLL